MIPLIGGPCSANYNILVWGCNRLALAFFAKFQIVQVFVVGTSLMDCVSMPYYMIA